jgi:predicted RNA-binding protein YlxR (DUF448 family)
MPADQLIRFVADPDGEVVADLRHRLPGRGAWVTARAGMVRIAERKHLFGRALGAPVTVASGLAERVTEQLRAAAVAALSLARKAGVVVAGFAKVEAALARGEAVALVHAAEASDDGVGKLSASARRASGASLPVIRTYTGEELSLAFGGANVVHAALLAGPASDHVLMRLKALADFVGEGGRADDASRLPLSELIAES